MEERIYGLTLNDVHEYIRQNMVFITGIEEIAYYNLQLIDRVEFFIYYSEYGNSSNDDYGSKLFKFDTSLGVIEIYDIAYDYLTYEQLGNIYKMLMGVYC